MKLATPVQPYQALAPYFDLVFPDKEFAEVFSGAIPKILRRLSKFKRLKILDLCCGTGRAMGLFAGVSDAELHGIDANDRMLSIARGKFSTRYKPHQFSKVHFSNVDIRKLSPKNVGSAYHVALMTGVSIQHFSHADRLLIMARVFDILHPGGIFVFDVLKTSANFDDEHPQAIAKRTLHVKDRTVKILYLRWVNSGRAFHHNIVVELPTGKRKQPIAHHDFFEFYPLNPNAADKEAATVGFQRIDDIQIEQTTTTFLCLLKPA